MIVIICFYLVKFNAKCINQYIPPIDEKVSRTYNIYVAGRNSTEMYNTTLHVDGVG